MWLNLAFFFLIAETFYVSKGFILTVELTYPICTVVNTIGAATATALITLDHNVGPSAESHMRMNCSWTRTMETWLLLLHGHASDSVTGSRPEAGH
jgi:hypothetical protein